MMDKLYYLPVEGTMNQATFDKLLLFVSKEKQEQVQRFYFNIDKKLSLYAEVVVRIIACQTLCIKNTDIAFEKGNHGKPYIMGYPNFHYNISHTRNAIAVAVSDRPVGVDIEKIKKAELQIANRFFTVAEQEYINEYTSEADKRFYKVWTKKEAYIKYVGKGLSMPLNSFNVFYKTIYTFAKDEYIISVCSGCNDKKYGIVELAEKQIESMVLRQLK